MREPPEMIAKPTVEKMEEALATIDRELSADNFIGSFGPKDISTRRNAYPKWFSEYKNEIN